MADYSMIRPDVIESTKSRLAAWGSPAKVKKHLEDFAVARRREAFKENADVER